MLTPSTVQACLAEIYRIWAKSSEDSRPWGVWISYHQPILSSHHSADTDVIAAWFLSNEKIAAKSPWDYVRYRVVQSGQVWCTQTIPPPNAIYSTGVHEIGLASFAQVEQQPIIYLDYIFGGRLGGGGYYRVSSSNQLIGKSNVWTS